MPKYVTAMFPLIITDGSPGFDQISQDEVVKIINQHLEMILFTRKGEIISDVNFGVGLEDYVFMQENEPALLALKGEISQQIGKYLGYLDQYLVVMDTSKVIMNQLGVQIRYRVDHLDVNEVADFLVGPYK